MAAAKKGLSPLVIAIIVIAVLVVGAGAYFMMNSDKKMGSSMMGENNAITSIKDALSKSVSMECVYEAEGTKTTAWIKNGAIRADVMGSDPQNSGSMIMKDNEKKMWFWNEEGGWTMDIPDSEGVEGSDQGANSQTQDIMKDLEQYKDSCKPAVVSDDKFSPPSDVEFMNMSDMMNGSVDEEQMKKMIEQYQDN